MDYADFQVLATIGFRGLCDSQMKMPQLLGSAMQNERVGKSMAFYLLTNVNEFDQLVYAARKDEFALQMLVDLHYAVTNSVSPVARELNTLLFKRPGVYKLVSSQNPSNKATEYLKYFTSLVRDYLLHHSNSASLKLSRERVKELDLSKLSKWEKLR